MTAPGRSGKKAKQVGRAAIGLAINALDVELEGTRRRAALGLVEVEKMTGLKSQEIADSIDAIDQTIELDLKIIISMLMSLKIILKVKLKQSSRM